MSRRRWSRTIWTRHIGCGFEYRNHDNDLSTTGRLCGVTDIRCLRCKAEWKTEITARPRKCMGENNA